MSHENLFYVMSDTAVGPARQLGIENLKGH